MITRKLLEQYLNDDTKYSFRTKYIDYDVKAITLLREKIPYEKCISIIGGACFI
jgi:hypothetical protein